MSRPLVRTARVPTAQASRYLQSLCKHWSHSFEVGFDKSRGRAMRAAPTGPTRRS